MYMESHFLYNFWRHRKHQFQVSKIKKKLVKMWTLEMTVYIYHWPKLVLNTNDIYLQFIQCLEKESLTNLYIKGWVQEDSKYCSIIAADRTLSHSPPVSIKSTMVKTQNLIIILYTIYTDTCWRLNANML